MGSSVLHHLPPGNFVQNRWLTLTPFTRLFRLLASGAAHHDWRIGRRLQHRLRAGTRRNGRRLPGPAPAPGLEGRHQVPAARVQRAARCAEPLLHRSAGGLADRSRRHRARARLRRPSQRPGVHRDGVSGGAHAARVHRLARAPFRARGGVGDRPRRRCAGRRPRSGDRPPRSEAGQHLRPDPSAGRGEDRRLRRGQAEPHRRPDQHAVGHGDRHAAVHVARTGAGDGNAGRPRRRVFAGLHPVRDAVRAAAVRLRHQRRGDRRPPGAVAAFARIAGRQHSVADARTG